MFDDRFILDVPGKAHRLVNYPDVAAFFEPRCDWENESQFKRPTPGFVTGPMDLHVLERARSRAGLDDCDRVPTDVCVLAAGEPANPAGTKFGGQPFWPEGRSWPTTKAGRPHRFLCQLNFADSHDVLDIDDLPEDVLCVTCPDEDWTWDLDFHWIAGNAKPQGDLDVPLFNEGQRYGALEGCWHGVRHRTFDYVGDRADDRAYAFADAGWMLSAAAATKIGGVPFEAQGADRSEGFVAQVASFGVSGNDPFQWLNMPSREGTPFERFGGLSFNDMGSFKLLLQPSGEVDFTIDSF